MKSTDTILGAFAVLGFVLLAFFAFAGSTSDSAIDTDELPTENEEALISDEELFQEDLNIDETTTAEEITITADNSDQVEMLAEELAANNLVDDLDPDTLRDSVAEFLRSDNQILQEEVLTDYPPTEEEFFESVTNEDIEAELEVDTPVEEAEEQLAATENEDIESDLVATETDDEDVAGGAAEEANEGSRISRFFSGLFGSDDTLDVGGNAEGEVVEEDEVSADDAPTAEGTYVVQQGDNVWDILTNDLGYTAGQAATAINEMRADSGFADSFGIDSGSVDLIYVGQTLNLSAL